MKVTDELLEQLKHLDSERTQESHPAFFNPSGFALQTAVRRDAADADHR